MLTFEELKTLKQDFVSGKISIDEAQKIYLDNLELGKKSWHTKDWNERKPEFLKDACEQCGSTETLTLQHLSHPASYYDHLREVIKEYNWLYTETHTSVKREKFIKYIKENFDFNPPPVCPGCYARNPNKRMRKKPVYLCTTCRHEFDEPAYRTIDELVDMFYIDRETADVKSKDFTSRNEYRDKRNLNNIQNWLLREDAKAHYSSEIEKEAFLRTLDDNIKYLSFEDTITACKKCAFNSDKNNRDLCPVCKTNYKGKQYQTCFDCLPEERRKIIQENREFAKSMWKMHKKLGI